MAEDFSSLDAFGKSLLYSRLHLFDEIVQIFAFRQFNAPLLNIKYFIRMKAC